ncbi:hypothetical protein SUBVAR_07047 [Subdoligranulum variabile DSM 15176]|uniref:Uncharacterized protein n=1 Tax=Subdoligranulum variabile DSM 15176 TaxID=411471 RepID=D1PRL9_9FIRM|nr:hypothetical protein SUBVAR_07047 [Subdoligranulum variabile DSM 15176]
MGVSTCTFILPYQYKPSGAKPQVKPLYNDAYTLYNSQKAPPQPGDPVLVVRIP